MKKIYKQESSYWYIERAVFLIAGIFIASSLVMVLAGFYNFIYFAIFVGIMLINFSLTGYCPMAILLSKLNMREK
jgi:hypothetical protein